MKLTRESLLPHWDWFFSKVDKKETPDKQGFTPCWMWNGSTRGNNGYGSFYAGGGKVSAAAHRASWALHFGDLEDGVKVCHKCDNPKCVNPDHLFLGTQNDNMKDMVAKGRQGPRRPRKGEQSNWNRFSEEQIMKIRELYKSGMYQKDIAKIFSTHQTTISGIIRCMNWKHLGLPSLSRFSKPKRRTKIAA